MLPPYNWGGAMKKMLQKIAGKTAALGGKFVEALGPFGEILILAFGLLVLFLLSKAGFLVPDFLGDKGLGGEGFLIAYIIGWVALLAAVFAVVRASRHRGFFRRWAKKIRRNVSQ